LYEAAVIHGARHKLDMDGTCNNMTAVLPQSTTFLHDLELIKMPQSTTSLYDEKPVETPQSTTFFDNIELASPQPTKDSLLVERPKSASFLAALKSKTKRLLSFSRARKKLL
jgi:hypothetical protein